MNFTNLKNFIALVNAGNISRAASQLYISQQTLSENLAKLELEIGTTLFNRGKHIVLTPAGKRFYSFALNTIEEQNAMKNDIQQIIDSEKKTVSCGVQTFESPIFLSNLLMRFYEIYPDYRVNIYSQKNLDSSAQDHVDVDFIFSDFDLDGSIHFAEADWHYECLSRSNRFAIIAKKTLLSEVYGDKWCDIEKMLLAEKSLSIVHNLPFLTVRNQNNLHYRTLKRAFELSGLEPNIGFQVDMNSLTNDLCAKGVAAYFGPEGLCRLKFNTFINVSDLCLYPVIIPNLYNGIAICYKKKNVLNSAQLKFIKLSKELADGET
ncbi:MAG: LysR family transcriptional regulator [Lachnospiraceae bacterium]|nr:LysR family transcriptional regulator [Lachnospiraceae bacterium]